MMFFLYTVAVLAALAALFEVYTAARAIGVPPVLSTCIYAGALFYLSSLLPGSLAVLTPAAVTATMVVLSALTIWWLSRVRATSRQLAASAAHSERERDVLAAVLLPAAPALIYYVARYRPWDGSRQTLSWDTVSYHLPGFIEYYQHQSLYSLDGPYQTYSFGFELIGNFPGYFFHHHWGLFIAHVYAVLFLFSALWLVTRNVLKLAGPQSFARSTFTYFVAVSCLIWMFNQEIFTLVGKNDIFQGACILGFMGLMLETLSSLGNSKGNFRTVLLIALSSLALALALATKPTALAYLPLVPVAYGLAYGARRSMDLDWNWRHAGLCLSASLIGIVAVGGFFLLRNLVSTGAVVAEETARWNLSILANVTNPALYASARGSLMSAASIFTPVAFLLLGSRTGSRYQVIRHQVSLFSLTALGAFVVSPWVVLPESAALRWELRLGLPLFAMMAIAVGMLAALCLERVMPSRFTSRWSQLGVHMPGAEGSNRIPSGWRPVVCVLALAVAAVLAPVFGSPVRGLPGFDSIKGRPKTSVYEWVQSIDQPTRIYAAGLRPYGLYGPRWQNGLFYDLHSSVLLPESAGRARVAAIVMQFRPNVLLISIDPHDYVSSNEKPLVNWIRGQSACFEDVFEDITVSGFRVKAGCEDRMKVYVRPGTKVRMIG